MLRNRKDYPLLMTPKGVAIYPSIHKPDYEYKSEGEFHARLRFDPDTPGLAKLVKEAEAIRDEAYEAKVAELKKAKKGALLKKLKKVPVLTEELDRESGDPTGFVVLRASMRHRIEIKNGPRAGEEFTKEPDVFDAAKNELKKVPAVGSGSELKLAVRPMDYFMASEGNIGVRFELEAVQIIKLVTAGQRDASSYGFDEEDGDVLAGDDHGFEEEDGYEAEEEDEDRDF